MRPSLSNSKGAKNTNKGVYIGNSYIKVTSYTESTCISNICSMDTCTKYIDIEGTCIKTSYIRNKNQTSWDDYICSSTNKLIKNFCMMFKIASRVDI